MDRENPGSGFGSRRFWHLVILLVAAIAGWVAWVAWQTRPRALVTELAYKSQAQGLGVAAASPEKAAVAKGRKALKQPLWAELSPEQQNLLRPLIDAYAIQ